MTSLSGAARFHGWRSSPLLIVSVCLGLIATSATDAHADKIQNLSQTLLHSKHTKARISAALSLGRLRNGRALQPLIKALQDRNSSVRTIAATALGHLGDSSALPALKRATHDQDDLVRRRATESVAMLRNLRAGSATTTRARNLKKQRSYEKKSRQVRARPTVYVSVSNTRANASKLRTSAKSRSNDTLRTLLIQELERSTDVTMSPNTAARYGLDKFSIDLSVIKMNKSRKGPYVEIECQLRATVSNNRGKMLSFLTGGARVQVPRRAYRHEHLAQLRSEAMENAVKGLYQDLVVHLRSRGSGSQAQL